MKVLVDFQIFLSQRYGGISNYHSAIDREINALQSHDRSTIIALGSDNGYVKSRLGMLKPLNRAGKRMLIAINKFSMERALPKYDVFHPSYYDNYFLKSKTLPPIVITIHDIIPERFFSDDRGMRLIANKRRLINRADAIIAISEATRKGILERYNIDPRKIEVVPHGRPDYFDAFKKKEVRSGESEKPYILFVGLRGSYKNFLFFLKGVSKFLLKHDISLKVIGPAPGPEEKKLVESLNVSGKVIFHISPSIEGLFHYYQKAFCFVFPSLDEGFGMPLLEAAAAGCPVVCSDIPVFHEICEDTALYFDPQSQDSLCGRLEELYSDNSLRQTLIAAGSKNLDNFSWEHAAQKTLHVYHKVARTNN